MNVSALLGDKLYRSLAGTAELYAIGKFREWVLDPGIKPKPPLELMLIVDGHNYPAGTLELAGGGTLAFRSKAGAVSPRLNLWTEQDTQPLKRAVRYDVNHALVTDKPFTVSPGADLKAEWLKQFGDKYPNGTHVYISGGTEFYVGGERYWWVGGHSGPMADSKLQTLPPGEYYKTPVDRSGQSKSERFTVGRKVNAWWSGTYGKEDRVQVWSTATAAEAEAALYAAGIPRPASSFGVYFCPLTPEPANDNVPPMPDNRPKTTTNFGKPLPWVFVSPLGSW